MSDAYTHAKSSVRKFGGTYEDYLPIHQWFDASKELVGDFRHRALRHHATGIVECEEKFGMFISVAREGVSKEVPVRLIAEQHLIEDFGKIPTVQDWFKCITPAPWMTRSQKLSATF